MKKIILILAATGLFIESAFAIYPTVRNYTRQEANAGTQSWDIFQHPNNWMYFANNNGLIEYDGVEWKRLPISNYTNVRSLCYDWHDDRTYAGAFNEFGYYKRSIYGQLEFFSLKPKIDGPARDFNEVWKIVQSREFTFFQSDKAIFRMRNARVEPIIRIDHPYKIMQSGMAGETYLICTPEEGAMGLSGNLFVPLPGNDQLKGKHVCAILPYEGETLFVTSFDGVYVYNGESIRPIRLGLEAFMRDNQVFCATIKESRLALGTVRNGLVVADLKTGERVFVNAKSGLQNNTVLSICFDRQSNLWLGLDRGIDHVVLNSQVYDLFGNNSEYGAGYTSAVKGNRLYLGTNQGLYVTAYPANTSPERFQARLVDHLVGQVWSLQELDRTLFCTTDRGTYIIRGDHAERINGVAGAWKLIELKAHPGYILGSSYDGFFLLKKVNGGWVYSHLLKGFDDYGGMFEEDAQGHIWFSHWMKGVYKLTFNARLDSFRRVELFQGDKVLPQRNNVLVKIKDEVVISCDGNFHRYNPLTGKLQAADEFDALFGFHRRSLRLTETPSGDLWCVSPGYFSLARKQPDGSFQPDTTSYSYLKGKLIIGFEHFNSIDSTRTLVSTEDGFSWIDPNLKLPNDSLAYPFRVSIKRMFVTNDGDSLAGGYQRLQTTIPRLAYKYNSIRFEFVAPEYRDQKAVNYSYMLEGYDDEWSAWSPVQSKEYTNLPYGAYTFRVRAQNLLDAETSTTFYQLEILPPWYLTPLAFGIYGVLSAGLLVLLYFYIRKLSERLAREIAIRKEREIKEQQERFLAEAAEREREIMELKNQQLEYDLRTKSRELANSTMNLMRKNEILLDLNIDIERILTDLKLPDSARAIVLTQTRLRTMQTEIKQNIERDDNWNKFAENFDMIYENFLKRLKLQFPFLTNCDLKICAYLKMELTSKEIAPLLNMSYRSVEMSRYRLRKKMVLNRSINLTEFLQKF
jgi:DNA-binding CsgD family transcriptional regulator